MRKNKKLFLFDIDGTIAVGNSLLDGFLLLLTYIRSIGGADYYITNNSTKSGMDYVNQFSNWGICTNEKQFVTSGYITALYLQQHFMNKKIYVVGTQSFIDQFRACDLMVTEKVESDIACVLVTFDNELRYEKLSGACEILTRKDVVYLATNPDLRCPAPFGFIPDCGAICHMIEDTVDRVPVYLGKPGREMVDLCIKESGFSHAETIVVGDRLYTDIACGIAGKVDTCVVFTGEAKPEDLKSTAYRPDFAFPSVLELYKALIKGNGDLSSEFRILDGKDV